MLADSHPLIAIVGPTASGKTNFAAHLAARLDAEIISADSRQVYRDMTIGTGKDLDDYIVDGQKIPYHLIDICNAGTKYNLFRYQEDFLNAYSDIVERGKQAILCGGTGLYVESVLKGYQLSPVPQNQALRDRLSGKSLEELTLILEELKLKNGAKMHNKTDVDSCQRAIRAIEIESYNLENPTQNRLFPPIKSLIIGIDIDRNTRRKKITDRLKQRLESGMIDEIKGLLERGIAAEDLIYYGLEYKFVTEYLMGKMDYKTMFASLEIAIHQFAKRQMTGFDIHWIDASLPMEDKLKQVEELLDSYHHS